jgi:SAM-dependent methyltransferase
MTILSAPTPALAAYERLGAHYDLLTAGYDHRRWVRALDRLAREHGLGGNRALDLACGTGRALHPLLELGYDVAGCDLSPAMLAIAGERHPGLDLRVADMRELPELGPFDLVLCLDDAVNYLLDERDLEGALRSVRSVLAGGGLLIFDVNTKLAYEQAFSRDRVVSDEDRLLAWRGHGLDETTRLARATVEIFARGAEPGCWGHERSLHVQRHWSDEQLAAAADAAGLRVLARVGQRTGVVLDAVADPARHHKVVYVLRPEGGAA